MWTRVKVGLVTSSSLAAPRPETMPLVNVVLPVPKSPVRRTSTGGWRRLENSLPQLVVSSAEWVMNSSATLKLPNEPATGGRDVLHNLLGQHAGNFMRLDGVFGSDPMQVDAKSQDTMPVLSAKLSCEPGKQAGKHITRSAFGQASVTGRVDEELARGRRNNGVKTF